MLSFEAVPALSQQYWVVLAALHILEKPGHYSLFHQNLGVAFF